MCIIRGGTYPFATKNKGLVGHSGASFFGQKPKFYTGRTGGIITLFPDQKDNELARIYKQISINTTKGSRTYYARLPLEDSLLIREDYFSRVQIPVQGNEKTLFYTHAGTLIAEGYNRIVIGDYGAYIEFRPDQIDRSKIRPLFAELPERAIKYIWLQVNDASRTKVYEQKETVRYADYKPGLYYISPEDLRAVDGRELYDHR